MTGESENILTGYEEEEHISYSFKFDKQFERNFGFCGALVNLRSFSIIVVVCLYPTLFFSFSYDMCILQIGNVAYKIRYFIFTNV